MTRTIVVTGASKGIGYAAAQALSAQGWNVIGVARHAPEAFAGEFFALDLSDGEATQAFAGRLAARGDVLGIVNNVGIAKQEQFGAIDAASFVRVIDLNVRPALQLTQELLPAMRASRFGRIVNVTSLVTRGLPFRASYAAAKSALGSLTRTMAIELAREGITANAVAPGPTETELFRGNNAPGSEGEARYLAQIPMKRLGRPGEIAAAIAFLLQMAEPLVSCRSPLPRRSGATSAQRASLVNWDVTPNLDASENPKAVQDRACRISYSPITARIKLPHAGSPKPAATRRCRSCDPPRDRPSLLGQTAAPHRRSKQPRVATA